MPGTLVAAVATGLGAIDVPVPATVGMVGMTWRFLRPVRPGDTIGARWRLNRKRPVDNPQWGLAVWQIEVENQRGETVAAGEMTRLVSRREQPAEPSRPGKNRRRRRRAAVEPVANHELPPKPTPGPLVEPVIKPAPDTPEPRPAETQVVEPSNGTPSRRRRRSSRPKPEVPAGQAVAESAAPPAAELPEAYPDSSPIEPQQPWTVGSTMPVPPAAPAPAATPSPRRRRRRGAPATRAPAELPAPVPAELGRPGHEPVPAETAAAGATPRRRRRPRSGTEQVELALREPEPSGGAAEPGNQPEPEPSAGAAEPGNQPEPGPTHHLEPQPLESGGSAGGLSGVLRRLRGT